MLRWLRILVTALAAVMGIGMLVIAALLWLRLSQPPLAPGAAYDYDFPLDRPGTNWMHSHHGLQEQRLMAAPLIVRDPAEAGADIQDIVVLFHDFTFRDPDEILAELKGPSVPTGGMDHSAMGHGAAAMSTGPHLQDVVYDAFLANDRTLDDPEVFRVERGGRLRLRLINAANARIFVLGLFGLEGWTMALDGMPLPAPEPLEEVLVLGPGQRADLIVDVIAEQGSTAYLARADEARGTPQVSFQVRGQASLARRGTPDALPPNPGDAFNLSGDSVDLTLNMEGGAMGTLRGAMLDGEETGFREMAQANQFWAFNGMVGMPDTPLATLDRGQIARLTISNDTAFPHAMHLHGMHFREVLADGTLGPMRDTLLMDSAERREIAFAADNPGDWLLHCHMLSHAVSGMMTWVRVA